MSDSLHPGGLQVFPVLHYVLEFAESHVHWIGDAIHLVLCCPLLLPSSFPASGSFPMSQLFASGGQSIGPSTSISVLPMNIQSWFPLGLTGLISLVSKGLSRVFSSTTIWNHQFFSAQPSLWSSSHPHAWLLENHSSDCTDLCQNHQWTDKSDCQHSP